MIEEAHVSFETARLLKEKGFNGLCHKAYHYYGYALSYHHKEKDFNGEEYSKLNTEWYSAPTQQMALQWLREKGIIITMDYDEYELISDNKKVGYGWGIQKTEKPTEYLKISIHVFDNYEEAVEDAIKYCLTNLV